ncbi:hypothetical protein ACU4GD_32290 [Cupriavidus basilensis]
MITPSACAASRVSSAASSRRARHRHHAPLGELSGLRRGADQAANRMSGGDQVRGDRAADKAERASDEEFA